MLYTPKAYIPVEKRDSQIGPAPFNNQIKLHFSLSSCFHSALSFFSSSSPSPSSLLFSPLSTLSSFVLLSCFEASGFWNLLEYSVSSTYLLYNLPLSPTQPYQERKECSKLEMIWSIHQHQMMMGCSLDLSKLPFLYFSLFLKLFFYVADLDTISRRIRNRHDWEGTNETSPTHTTTIYYLSCLLLYLLTQYINQRIVGHLEMLTIGKTINHKPIQYLDGICSMKRKRKW